MSRGTPADEAGHDSRAATESDLRSSIVALVLGIILALVVAKLVGLIGIGGDLASQAAGAASGAAPLLVDGFRRRRAVNRRLPRVSLSRVRFGRPGILVGSLFGFALLGIDTLIGPYLGLMTRRMLRAATGSDHGWVDGLIWAEGFVQVPVVCWLTIWLARAAAHRMLTNKKRWIWFGIALYVAVRLGMVIVAPPQVPGLGPAGWVVSALVLGALLGGLSMIGVRLADRTQPAFVAAAFFNQLTADDQQAALALLANNDDDPSNDMPVTPLHPRHPGPHADAPGELPSET